MPTKLHPNDAAALTDRGFLHDYGMFCPCTQCIPIEMPAADEDWKCGFCGTTPHTNGFYPCNDAGIEVEPTPDDWPRALYACGGCGAIHEAIEPTTTREIGAPTMKRVDMRVRVFSGMHQDLVQAEINTFLASLENMIVPDIKWCMVVDPTTGPFYSALVIYYPR